MIRTLCVRVALVLLPSSSQALEWHGLSLAGDDSIVAFDNSQRDLTDVLLGLGLVEMTRLTSSHRVAKREKIGLLTSDNLADLASVKLAGDGEGCLVHLTSHGTEGAGIHLARGDTYIDPPQLDRLLDGICGEQPTVVLISACFSGQFITPEMEGPNRIILTAARADRPSFGCSADDTYTFWDGCLIEQLPQSSSWSRVYQNVSGCIEDKEASGGELPSEPQAYFGANTRKWRVLQ